MYHPFGSKLVNAMSASEQSEVLTMNQLRQQKTMDSGTSKDAIVIKPSNIRIWIHDKDIGKLARVLWEGQGNRLRTEVSSNNKVKKFLDAVPSIMNIIKEVHSAVVDNDIESLVSRTLPPAPIMLLTSKDANGLTPLHKAAGLAHARIVEYLLNAAPDSATDTDFTGKTPLHWAASAKNNPRSYNLLVQAGCDEQALDYKMKTPAYYKAKPNDIDRSLLTVTPEAPRVPQQGLPPGYDWNMLSEDAMLTNPNNNYIRKSQSNYESYTILSDDPPPATMLKRNLSTEEMRNGNISSPTSPKVLSQKSNAVIDSDHISEPLTTEEQAVLVAIDPINERLYVRTPSNASPARADRADTPIPDFNANDDQPEYENEFNDKIAENEPETLTDIDLETGIDLQSTPEMAVEAIETDDLVNGGYENDAIPSTGETKDANNDGEENQSALFIYQRTFNPNEKVDGMYSLESEDQDTLKDDSEATTVANEDVPDVKSIEGEEAPLADLELEDPADVELEDPADVELEDSADVELEDPADVELEDSADVELENPADVELEDSSVVELEDPAVVELEDEEAAVDASDENNNEDGFDPDLIDEELANDEIKALTNDNEEEANDEEIGSYKEEQDEQDDNEHDKEISPSPAMQFEGVVTGLPDNGVVQSEGGQIPIDDDDETDENDDESQIKSIISNGDMEQLAALVLNGKGLKLIGKTSSSPEIQAFLDNVSAYMNKIRRVHLAAREGSLRDLQSALDRRKFAVAKDDISPNGCTPLHVATVFGHAGIIRYLAGRFPETMAAVDNNGRTALHYAATINDNGHFFNLLSHLGSNPKAEDNMGHSAEFYTNHEQSESVLSHRMILKQFGAEEQLADDMLNDQDARNNTVEIPLFRTEEGRYLATTLGDPLIKGLTEVANSRPTDPIAFLANYLNGFSKQRTMSTNTTDIVEDSQVASPVKAERRVSIVEASSDQDEPPGTSDGPELASSSDDRDEHGQSLLHFASARSHARNGLIQLIEESKVSVTFRDELYRTARDVSLQASHPDNAREIDRYILGFAARGELDFFENLVSDGYDHIIDITDKDGNSIIKIAEGRGQKQIVDFLSSVKEFEENREKLHRAIREGNIDDVVDILSHTDGTKLAKSKNYFGRNAAHVAVLKENEEIVGYIASRYKQSLRVGDNLERTPLHYAMGLSSVESLSRILIKNGAKRVLKDLKGRQPSYYFMNKADILRLQEEEEEHEEEDAITATHNNRENAK